MVTYWSIKWVVMVWNGHGGGPPFWSWVFSLKGGEKSKELHMKKTLFNDDGKNLMVFFQFQGKHQQQPFFPRTNEKKTKICPPL
jgi:hypothetical protein